MCDSLASFVFAAHLLSDAAMRQGLKRNETKRIVIGVQRTKVVVVGSVIESDRKLIVELQLNWG